MDKKLEEILRTITAKQWEAIAAYAAEKAKETSIPEVQSPVEEEISLRKRVTYFLRDLGVPANLDGYHYLREAIILVYKDQRYRKSITKDLYPDVAKMFETKWNCVEKSIRHAIEVTWDKGDSEELFKVFKVTPEKAKPENGEFIATAVEYLQNF